MARAILRHISKRSMLLFALDLCAVYAAYSAATYLCTGNLDLLRIQHLPVYLYGSLAVFPFIFYLFDLYYPFKYFMRTSTLIEVVLGVGLGALILAAAAYFDKSLTISRLIFAYTAATLAIQVYLIRLFYDFLFKSRFLNKRALLIGTGPLAAQLAGTLRNIPHSGIELMGFVSEKKHRSVKEVESVPVVGDLAGILSLIDWYGVQLVVLALDPKEEVSEAAVMSKLLQRQVLVTSGLHLYEKITGEVPYHLLGSHYLLGLMSQVKANPYLKIKRILDIAAALALLLALAPVLALSVIVLALSNPRQIFFTQNRIGKGGKPFRLLKLRSMAEVKKGKPRITKIGKWIRRYRIDEIPQLINVLRGEMSLIGPRPEVPFFVHRSRNRIPFYDAVFSVKPGITGWAQIHSGHTTTVKDYQKKFRHNLYYLKNLSFKLDLLILLQTVRIVLLGKGK